MHNSSSLAAAACLVSSAMASSRVAYKAGVDNRITIGRSMDFLTDTNTTIWTFPPALRRYGGVSGNPFTWTTRYGSVSAVVLDQVYVEGLNTEGLSGSAMYTAGSGHGERVESRDGMFENLWMQYFLDMYASVAEAASDYCPSEGGEEKFQVVGRSLLEGIDMGLHVTLSDKKGDNLILEFIKGKLKCHRSRKYNVVTNMPSFDKELAIDALWSPVSEYALPDRFVRLSHYNSLVPQAPDLETAVAYTAGMIRAVSTPMIDLDAEDENGDEDEEAGTTEVWPTMWRMFTDTLDKVVFYESATSPMSFWYDVSELNLTEGAQVTRLPLVDMPWRKRVGDVTDKFEPVSDNECIWTVVHLKH
ncbi:nucleophile aminohydrolase [Dactylonectria macrodidyma]|uniref:Nucleophile aminohydrolase n=1 Tax=Dactylonectria macrodidyma TaxID=307937 RepID=A0A9P9JND6_9HYPO|nr:nucleophile aminohydrolase [Dactylonectria macrodidyma]